MELERGYSGAGGPCKEKTEEVDYDGLGVHYVMLQRGWKQRDSEHVGRNIKK